MQKLKTSSANSLNNSLSKQKYSFPKSPRFSNSNISVTDSFYNLPSIKNRRSTSFGYGKKDIGMRYLKISPSPQAYNISSEFEKSKKQKKGFSFGQGREDMMITGPLGQSLTKKYIPSPSLYYPKKQIEALNITLKSKIKDNSLKHLIKNPGPGAYSWEQMGKPNYYIASQHENKINYRISSSPRPDTLPNQKFSNPKVGPGSYDLKSTQLNKSGEYKISNSPNSKAAKFSKQSRPSMVIKHLLTTPGPTKYEKISEFNV